MFESLDKFRCNSSNYDYDETSRSQSLTVTATVTESGTTASNDRWRQ
jgi:hypothetical protein